MTPRRSSGTPLESLRHRLEPLWPGALVIHFVALGSAALSPATVYRLLLGAYLPLVVFIAVGLPRVTSRSTASLVRLGIVAAGVIELVWYVRSSNWIFLLTATMAAIVTVVALGYAGGRQSSNSRGSSFFRILPVLFASAFGFLCAGSLITWNDPMQWIARTPVTAAVTIIAIVLSGVALREGTEIHSDRQDAKWLDYLAIAVLIIFSFRTAPISRLDDWASITVPMDLLSRTAPVVFWLLQSVALATVVVLLYVGIRNIASAWLGRLFALVVSFATVFFIPQNADKLLAAQMMPSVGPLRFVWCFVLLAFISRHYFLAPEKSTTRELIFGGTLIWLAAVLWSAESAAYCSAIWLACVGVFTVQRAKRWRDSQLPKSDMIKRAAQILLTPPVALAAVMIVVASMNRAVLDTMPNWGSYVARRSMSEMSSDPIGPVWYVLLLFALLSIIGAMTLARDADDSRLVPLAGLWAGFWAAAGLLLVADDVTHVSALAPFLIFTLATAVRVMRSDRTHRWHRIVIAALVPAFAMQITTVFGHQRFRTEIFRPQSSPARVIPSDD